MICNRLFIGFVMYLTKEKFWKLYFNGKGVEQDFQEAVRLYQLAVDIDTAEAMVKSWSLL